MMTIKCTPHDITWSGLRYQCLRCGATGDHSWDIKHYRVRIEDPTGVLTVRELS